MKIKKLMWRPLSRNHYMSYGAIIEMEIFKDSNGIYRTYSRGVGIGDALQFKTAKKICQEHYETLIKEAIYED